MSNKLKAELEEPLISPLPGEQHDAGYGPYINPYIEQNLEGPIYQPDVDDALAPAPESTRSGSSILILHDGEEKKEDDEDIIDTSSSLYPPLGHGEEHRTVSFSSCNRFSNMTSAEISAIARAANDDIHNDKGVQAALALDTNTATHRIEDSLLKQRKLVAENMTLTADCINYQVASNEDLRSSFISMEERFGRMEKAIYSGSNASSLRNRIQSGISAMKRTLSPKASTASNAKPAVKISDKLFDILSPSTKRKVKANQTQRGATSSSSTNGRASTTAAKKSAKAKVSKKKEKPAKRGQWRY